MAKEMMIMFVYDTKLLQKEEDDPASAIVYFHPTWVSDQQKTALCGQIMGTVQCLKSIFCSSKIVSLQSGKFYLIENGRYLLVIGTDRNITDVVLEHRAKMLYSLFNFYHNDLICLSEQYPNREAFSAKLYHILETYIEVIFFGGNIFSHMPILTLPKSASTVFTEAIHILQCCQHKENVLGGSILYHNKTVSTQLSPELTKNLIQTNLYRVKCPADSIAVPFDLPIGVQLMQVFIPNKDLNELIDASSKTKNTFQYLSNNKTIKSNTNSSIQPQIVSQMKRDQSLLFTSVPEEGTENETFIPKAKKTRPKFLNLKSISIESSAEVIKATPSTPFCGPTSVCSTPMTELKKFVHQNPLSLVQANKNKIFEQTESAERNVPIRKSKSCFSFNIEYNLINLRKTKSLPNIAVRFSENIIKTKKKNEVKLNGNKNEIKTVQLENREKRKSLTLPLKPISSGGEMTSPLPVSTIRKGSGVQLTPLMSKLSMLAFEETSSGFYSQVSTPGTFTPCQNLPSLPLKSLKTKTKTVDEGLHRCALFVCRQQDIVLALLLQESSSCPIQSSVIKELWEICTEHLAKLEKQLRYSMESQPSTNSNDDPYSYLCLDKKWDTVQRGGPWGTSDLNSLNSLHRDFKNVSGLTEILIRSCESVIYGYHIGGSEVFYQEGTGTSAGLPTPADPMASAQLKARKKLERDHAIILL